MRKQNCIRSIIEGCKHNDHLSQIALFEMFHDKMLNVCLNYVPNEQEAKDIVQLSFIKVFKSITKFRDINTIEGWIRRIVVNTAIDEIRKDKIKGHTIDINSTQLEASDKIYDETTLNIILKEVDKLPQSFKTAFELHVIEGHTHIKIASMLNIHEGTSKSNLFRAKAKLREVLKDKLAEEYIL